jgi:hypothetical protein
MTHTLVQVALLAVTAVACATPRPILYPNQQYREVGEQQMERDVEECITLAKEFDASPPRQTQEGVGGDVVEGATVGAATGAAVGAVVGNVGRGAGAGAAGGAARSLVRGIFRGPEDESPYTAFHSFVERCLEDRGYEVVGWS